MAGYGGETGTASVSGGGTPSLDVRRVKPQNQYEPFSGYINKGISSGGQQLLNLTQRVDSSDIALFSADEDKGKSVLPAARNLRFNNQGDSIVFIQPPQPPASIKYVNVTIQEITISTLEFTNISGIFSKFSSQP